MNLTINHTCKFPSERTERTLYNKPGVGMFRGRGGGVKRSFRSSYEQAQTLIGSMTTWRQTNALDASNASTHRAYQCYPTCRIALSLPLPLSVSPLPLSLHPPSPLSLSPHTQRREITKEPHCSDVPILQLRRSYSR